jgi:hypothetical protein
MLFWILLGLEIGVVALAFLCDYIWKDRLNLPTQRQQIGCRYCAQGHLSVEVVGLWVHQFQDRWISCSAHHQLQTEVGKVQDAVATSLAGSMA